MALGLLIYQNHYMDTKERKTYYENCGKEIKGRSDKRFCDDNCRNTFNHQKKIPDNEIMSPVINILKKNRSVLSSIFNGDGNKILSKLQLVGMGFNFDYCTDRRVLQGVEYYFCFDYGYEISQGGQYAILSTTYFEFIYRDYLHQLPNMPIANSDEPDDLAYWEMLRAPLRINSEIKEPPKSSITTKPDLKVVE